MPKLPPAGQNSEAGGLVIASHGQRGRIETEPGDAIPYLAASRRHKPVCGDRARLEIRADDSPALLRAILPRRNELARTAPNGSVEVVAANFSLLAVVAAPQPVPDCELIDRLLCAAAQADAGRLVLWNKIDLDGSLPARLGEYAAAGFEMFAVSALAGAGIAPLRRRLAEHVTVLAGQSGAGKSTLVNALLGSAVAAAGPLSDKADLGRHTTASAAMYRLANGGQVMDLPGVRSLMPVLGGYRDVAAGFPEFARHAAECRFANCRHRSEPGCAVLAAVATGRVPAGRHASYLALLREFEEAR